MYVSSVAEPVACVDLCCESQCLPVVQYLLMTANMG
jgi:hypothetical protein